MIVDRESTLNFKYEDKKMIVEVYLIIKHKRGWK